MALIKCEECGKDVSSNAAACPNCGNPIKVEPKERICDKCGGKVANNAYKCPHCFSELSEDTVIRKNDSTNILAVAGFLFGLISLFIDIFGIISILAIIFSGIGLTQANNRNEKGTGLATFGFIFGLLSLGYFIYKIVTIEQYISIFYQ